MKKIFIFIVLAMAAGIFSFSANLAQAQQGNEEGENITVSPATIKPNLIAGEEFKGNIKLLNNGKTNYTFKVYAKPFSVQEDSYKAEFETVNKYTEVYQWITFDQGEYQLDSGKNITVPFTITVPEDARPGGHYAVLFAETQPAQEESVARKKRVGSLMYATVEGEYLKEGKIESFTSDRWFKSGPVTSEIRARNDGNVHYELTTDVVYKTIFGKAAYSERQTRIVMPGTTRKIGINWQDVPVFGIYKLTGTAQYLDKTEDLQSRYILVMPYWIIAAIVALLVLKLVISLIKRKSRKANNENKSEVEDERK